MKAKDSYKTPRKGPIWKPFVGKEIKLFFEKGNIYGVLNQPNIKEGYVDFLPVMIQEVDSSKVYLETKIPLTMALSKFQDPELIIRPLKEGALEKEVKYLNDNIDKDISIGFNSK